jgi:hypothetical protein
MAVFFGRPSLAVGDLPMACIEREVSGLHRESGLPRMKTNSSFQDVTMAMKRRVNIAAHEALATSSWPNGPNEVMIMLSRIVLWMWKSMPQRDASRESSIALLLLLSALETITTTTTTTATTTKIRGSQVVVDLSIRGSGASYHAMILDR